MTTDDRPAPPVPAECDLRAFPYIPLDVIRLRDSELVSSATGEEFRAAVLLWCASWHQVPASSLPKDDRSLAHLVGYGRDLRGWAKVRAGAMRGWYEADDGKLYHPVVSEKADEAWQARVAQRAKTEAARLARAANRKPSQQQHTEDVTLPVTTSVTEPVTDSKGEGREREGKGRDCITSPPSPAAPAPDPAAATAGLRRIVKGYDPKRLLVAIQAGDLLAVVAAFGGNLARGDEWARDSAGQRIGTIAAVMDFEMAQGRPVREPSGLRKAIETWTAQPLEWRKRAAHEFAQDIGLPVLSRGAEQVTKPPPDPPTEPGAAVPAA